MRKIFFAIIIILLVNIGLVSSHEHDFAETKQLIDSGVSCDKLTDEQLEAIGDYYMEQMHPGEAHEMMDKMMGGEDSESLKQIHIQMAKRLYCNEGVGGMMGMMGGGMMNMMAGGQIPQTNMMQGMMVDWEYGFGYRSFVDVLYVIILIGLVILVYLWIIKLWRDFYGRKK